MPVDEVYSAIIEEVSQALMPSDEEELFVKTEEEETSHYWRVVDVDYGIASCVNLNTEQASGVNSVLEFVFLKFNITSILFSTLVSPAQTG